MKRFFSWLLVFSFLLLLTVPAMAADNATGTTLRLEEINGTVTVKDASGNDKTVRASMRLYSGYTITTGASSSAYISLDETKAVKLDSSGKVEIKKSGKKLEVSLTAGQLYFNVTEPLKADESLNIRTSTMVTGIRGSFGWVNLTQIGLMHGHVTLTCMNPETGETRVTEVYSGEKVSYEQEAPQDTDVGKELEEIGFIKEEIVLADVPATVVEEIAKDETLQAQLEADVPTIDVTELVESLPEKQAEEKALEEQAQETVEAAIIVQEEAIAAEISDTAEAGDTEQDYVDLSGNTATPAPTDTSDSSSDDSGSTVDDDTSGGDYTPVVTSGTAESASELTSKLSTYSTVTYTATYESGNNTLTEDLTIPVGKTLILAAGSDLTVASGKTLTNKGTIEVYGMLTNNGTVDNHGTLNIHPAS